MRKFRTAAVLIVVVAGLSARQNMSRRQQRDTAIGVVGGGALEHYLATVS